MTAPAVLAGGQQMVVVKGPRTRVQARDTVVQMSKDVRAQVIAPIVFETERRIVAKVTPRDENAQAQTIRTWCATRWRFVNDPRWYQTALAGVHAQIHESRENEITASIKHEAWGDAETRTRVRLRNIRGVDYAYVAHEGWGELPAKLAEDERRRFVGIWLNALSDFSADSSHKEAQKASA